MDAAQSSAEFAPSADEVRRVGYRVVDLIASYLERLPTEPVFRPVSAKSTDEWISSSLSQDPASIDQILDDIAREVMPHPFGNGHPRFYGWVNSPPSIVGIFTDAIAATMNPSVAGGNHAAVWVERQLMEWFKTLIGFPAEAIGLLVSGGSSAAITALSAARFRACTEHGIDVRKSGVQRLSTNRAGRLLIYKTAEGHGCNQKAVELLGLGSDGIRVVPNDERLAMIPSALDQMIQGDIASGHIPVAVIASAGTVNTGAIDPIEQIADVCANNGVWLHVDAAYGGPAIVTRQYENTLRALSRADSVALDPHKWMYVPVDAGVVLVRHADVMRAAHSLVPAYLRTDGNLRGVQGPPWFSEYGLEQTRPFRALKVWTSLRYFGVRGYRELIEHDIELAEYLAATIRKTSDFAVWEPISLSIVCFRWTSSSQLGDEAIDAVNRSVLEDVQLSGKAFLSGTVLNGRFWLRACIVNPLATQSDIDIMVDAVKDAVGRHSGSLR